MALKKFAWQLKEAKSEFEFSHWKRVKSGWKKVLRRKKKKK